MRTENVRRIKHKHQSIVATALVAIAVMLVSMVAFAKPPVGEGPYKVAICHFDGHEHGLVFHTGLGLDGDYVIDFNGGQPSPVFCNKNGGEMLIVSVNALKGHRVQLETRKAEYEAAGWKG